MRLLGRAWGVALAAGVALAGIAAAQPAPAPTAAPAAPPSPAALRGLDRELDRACFRRIDRATLAARVAALLQAGHARAALERAAPETMLTLARLQRQAGAQAEAAAGYDGLIAAATDDARRGEHQRERAMMAAEEALLAAGVARPEDGALLVALRDAPGPAAGAAAGRARVGLWVKPDCTPFAVGDGRSLLVLYRTTDGGTAAVGSPVPSAAATTFMLDDDAWGSDATGDGRPVVSVLETNGGNCWACTRLRLFVAGPEGLAALRVEAPDFVVPQAVATVDGQRVLIANDVRWETFGDVCHACAPGVAVALAWRDGRFQPACRTVPAWFRQRLAELAGGLAERDPQYRFGAVTSRLLLRIQIGEAEQAWPEYRHAMAVLRRLRGVPRNGFRPAENQLGTALRAARPALAAAACPVNALALR